MTAYIARALALAGGDTVEMLGGPLGEDARAARGELLRASQRERAEWLAEARTPVPPGLRGVHPSWIEAALDGLPARARAAIASGGGGPVDVWLARWACAAIPPMPPVRSGPVHTLADVLALPADALERWLRAVGQAQIAYAVSLAQPNAPRRRELGPARAVIARCRDAGTVDALLVGARALAPHVLAFAARQLAHRLPRATGLAVLAELRAHAGNPAVDAPSWDALATSSS